MNVTQLEANLRAKQTAIKTLIETQMHACTEQKDAAGDLQQSVKTFQDYANLKNLVKSSCCLESHLVVLRELDR